MSSEAADATGFSQTRQLDELPLLNDESSLSDFEISPHQRKPNNNVNKTISTSNTSVKPTHRCCRILDTCRLEPFIVLYCLSAGIMWPTYQGLIYRKICLQLYGNDSSVDCSQRLTNTTEDNVQTRASHFAFLDSVCFEIPSIFMTLLYGAVSDGASRKAMILMPCIGGLVSSASVLLSAVYIHLDVRFILVGSVFNGLGGGWITSFMSLFSYLSETTSLEHRTMRISIVEGLISTSIALAMISSGYMVNGLGFVATTATGLALFVLAIVYALIFIPDIRPSSRNEINAPKSSGSSNRFSCSHVCTVLRETVTSVFRRREGNKRLYLLLSYVLVFFSIVTYSAMFSVSFLFLKHAPLHWRQSTYGLYSGVRNLVSGAATLILVPLMTRRLRMRDTSILLVGLCSAMLAELQVSLSTKTWMVFTATVVGMFADARSTCIRSILSQLVEHHELGKAFAVMGSLQSASMLSASAIYNNIYPLTLKFWPGFSFALGACLSLIPISIVSWMHIRVRNDSMFNRDVDNSPNKVV